MNVKTCVCTLISICLTANAVNAQLGGGGGTAPTSYYVFAKNLMIKPVLPAGAPTDPPDPDNFPPLDMDIKVQYEIFQSYCDIEEHGARGLEPARTFRGKIGSGAGWDETVAPEVVGPLSYSLPAAGPHIDTVDMNKSPMKLYSELVAAPAGWDHEHTFVSDMSGGPMLVMDPSARKSVEVDANDEVTKVEYRIQVGWQTPASEQDPQVFLRNAKVKLLEEPGIRTIH